MGSSTHSEPTDLPTPPPTSPKVVVGYDLPTWRKYLILFVISWLTLVVTFSSTSMLIATPEIASDLSTTPEILDVTNAGVLVAMGLSSLIWSPLSDLFGRRKIYDVAIFFMFVPSIGAAVAPNLAAFTAMRLVGGLTGTYFMVAGQTVITDIFEPLYRGQATGFFMVGSVAGPALGPCIGGVIVTFSHWRDIYWLQAAMSGFGLVLSIIVIPSIKREVEVVHVAGAQKLSLYKTLQKFNPLGVFRQLLSPNILLADVTCGCLAVTQYGILTSVRHVINPRFNLTTPLISGIFYIAPGAGFFVGSIVGGRLSDRTVRRYIAKRNGIRLPGDRLNSGLIGLFVILPISLLLLGWGLQEGIGGLALPIVAAFWAGVGLMGTFNALNTYTAEVNPAKKAEVICTKYIVQYLFGAGSSAAIVPLIDAIGVGWSFTFLVALDFIGGGMVLLITRVWTKVPNE
ncbi:MFS transporter, putative [Talaromyces stipitatus ATCC 10500]|uniref:MFS transporter, putative n=1 Tax=Talaromyces stipitatus (strain ATCC 10500 / CBS 375.48 / QM 6759 / NRRL 1006) TaxID=441959 RepID=B8MNX4_TALSN|nr:MFS transporter, putative [Talaromyces stipitatus ATCC 10500]EED14213.1 MFS transporter, putative [Talaromyces stipitatus ATCC 10500]